MQVSDVDHGGVDPLLGGSGDAGPRTAACRIVAPDPATHQLTVAVVAPRAADIQVWLARFSSRLPVLASTRDAKWCRPSQGKIRCEVRRHPGARVVDGKHRQALSPAGSHPGHGHLHAGMTLHINGRENDRQELARVRAILPT
jgi:hypothetical protein